MRHEIIRGDEREGNSLPVVIGVLIYLLEMCCDFCV